MRTTTTRGRVSSSSGAVHFGGLLVPLCAVRSPPVSPCRQQQQKNKAPPLSTSVQPQSLFILAPPSFFSQAPPLTTTQVARRRKGHLKLANQVVYWVSIGDG